MNYKNHFSTFMQILISLPLLVVFIAVVWQVFSRYILAVPSENSEELIRFALVFLTFLAGAYCFLVDRHISLDLIEAKKSSLFSFFCKSFEHFLLYFFLLLF